MMGRVEKSIVFVLLAVLLCLIAVIILQSVAPKAEERIYNVSVLVDDLPDPCRRGMDKAALERNVDVHYISGFGRNALQQTEYMQREIDNGVDAVILQAADSEAVSAWFASAHPAVRTVTIGDALLPGENTLHVGPDNLLLGRMLGERMLQSGTRPTLVLMETGDSSGVAERCEGIASVYKDAGVPLECRYVRSLEGSIASLLADRPASTVAVLEESMLLRLCEEAREEDNLFGVGFVGDARTKLESGRLEALAVYGAFDEGYRSMLYATQTEGAAPANAALPCMLVDAANMYDAPQAQVLFPIS